MGSPRASRTRAYRGLPLLVHHSKAKRYVQESSHLVEIQRKTLKANCKHLQPLAVSNNTLAQARKLCGVESSRSCIETAHGGSYSIYYALALASKELKADHRYVTYWSNDPSVLVENEVDTLQTRLHKH